jgi:hypothetical protein
VAMRRNPSDRSQRILLTDTDVSREGNLRRISVLSR